MVPLCPPLLEVLLLALTALLGVALAAPACPEGQVAVNRKGSCCWPGQGWSWSKKQCTGMPRQCPDGWSVERPPPGSSQAPFCRDLMASVGRPAGQTSGSKDPIRWATKVPVTEHMSLAPSIILGPLDPTLVEGVLLENASALGHCARIPVAAGLEGSVTLGFAIDRTGRVSSAEVRSTTLDHAETGRCLASVLKGLEFPKPMGGGRVTAETTFVVGGQ